MISIKSKFVTQSQRHHHSPRPKVKFETVFRSSTSSSSSSSSLDKASVASFETAKTTIPTSRHHHKHEKHEKHQEAVEKPVEESWTSTHRFPGKHSNKSSHRSSPAATVATSNTTMNPPSRHAGHAPHIPQRLIEPQQPRIYYSPRPQSSERGAASARSSNSSTKASVGSKGSKRSSNSSKSKYSHDSSRFTGISTRGSPAPQFQIGHLDNLYNNHQIMPDVHSRYHGVTSR